MASKAATNRDLSSGQGGDIPPHDAALQQFTWRSRASLSSFADTLEKFLDAAGFDRGPWLAVSLAVGIALWFALDNRWEWLSLIALALGSGLLALVALSPYGRHPHLRQAIIAVAFALAAGCGLVWAKSALVGTPPIARPTVAALIGTVLERYDEPAEGKLRLQLAVREPRTDRPIRVSLTVPAADERPDLAEGAVVRLRARLMPPMPPRLPGGRDSAREAWFSGLAANGSALGPVEVVTPALGWQDGGWHGWAWARHALSAHVRGRVPGSAGGIAATLVSGNRGGIAFADQQAMRDAGLTHLLAISGLHVSAVVAGAYFLAFRLLALWPWLALRVRVPVMATLAGALAGVSYTLLTGMHLPTVRACTGALLVLAAMLLGRQPHSLRLLAAAAVAVMLLWPEEVIGPSFQMSFGSVIAIIALHGAAPAHAFLAHRAEPWWRRVGRHLAMLLLSGMVIDLALMPVALFHFHRAGVFGSLANLIAIPLVTFVAMPAIAAGLVLDIVGAGAPAWWVVGRSLELLLAVTHWIVARPGAVSLLPTMSGGTYALFVGGMVWLGLWRGRVRLLGLIPPMLATVSLAGIHPPDMLITGDGRNIGIAGGNGDLLVLRMGRSAYTREMFLELTGLTGKVAPLESWPGAHCNRDFCAVELSRGGRIWRVLVARNEAMVSYAAMARACASVDIVVAERKLYGPCAPALLKADKALLMRTGGLALDLTGGRITSVEDSEGEHPWWRAPHHLPEHADDDWTIAPSGPPPGNSADGESDMAASATAGATRGDGLASPMRSLPADTSSAAPRASGEDHARR